MQIASLGAAIGLPPSFYTSTPAVVTWYLNASVSALNTLAGEDHSDVAILQCSMQQTPGVPHGTDSTTSAFRTQIVSGFLAKTRVNTI